MNNSILGKIMNVAVAGIFSLTTPPHSNTVKVSIKK